MGDDRRGEARRAVNASQRYLDAAANRHIGAVYVSEMRTSPQPADAYREAEDVGLAAEQRAVHDVESDGSLGGAA